MDAGTLELALRRLVNAIVSNDDALFRQMMARQGSELARASFCKGAQRARLLADGQERNSALALGGELDTATVLRGSSRAQRARLLADGQERNSALALGGELDTATVFLKEIGQNIYSGDTALHFAAASYRRKMADQLIRAGANVRARNRRGGEPLHAAAFGIPGSPSWDPAAQSATISCLLEAGADLNAQNLDGATALHRAVRTRCADAVRTLLDHGADPTIRNKNGSTAGQLALLTTGRGGSGSAEAKIQQREILRLLKGPDIY
jgi:hypothetical protein